MPELQLMFPEIDLPFLMLFLIYIAGQGGKA